MTLSDVFSEKLSGLIRAKRFATAWVIVKALLPLRIPLSVWATPWFARVALVPSINLFKRLLGKIRRKPPKSSAAGTGATAAGVGLKSRSKT